jgi:hypothetical protein
MDLGESTSRLILLTRVLRIRSVVMITPYLARQLSVF